MAAGAGEALKISLLAVVENLEGRAESKAVIKSTFFYFGEFWTLKYGVLLLRLISAEGLC